MWRKAEGRGGGTQARGSLSGLHTRWLCCALDSVRSRLCAAGQRSLLPGSWTPKWPKTPPAIPDPGTWEQQEGSHPSAPRQGGRAPTHLLVWELQCMNQLRLLSTYMAQALSSLPSIMSLPTLALATPKAGSGWLS